MIRLIRVLMALCLTMTLAACLGHEDTDKTGRIYFAGGPDVGTGSRIEAAVGAWNDAHPNEPVTFLPLSPRADDVHAQLLANAQHPDDVCYDVMALDVVWTKEFATDGYLVALDKAAVGLSDQPEHLRTVIGPKDGTWAVPFTSDVGMLYYRTDIVGPAPPTSWDAMIARATPGKYSAGSGYGAQFGPYEGVVVNFLERAWAHMGDTGSDRPNLQAIRQALNDLQQAFREQAIPAETLDDAERDSLNAFVAGRIAYMRNWPIEEQELASNPDMKGRYKVVPMPWKSILGGLDLAEGHCSAHRKTATSFIRYMTSAAVQKSLAAGGYLPTRDLPTLDKYRASLRTAVARPSMADYAEVSPQIQAIVRVYLRDCLPSTGYPGCRSDTEDVARKLDALLSPSA